jgi:radical SAM superfamily enzyme YgiQ (UPF0313 family)
LPPTDLLTLAAVAEQMGYSCEIHDYSTVRNGQALFRKDLARFRPDVVMVSSTAVTVSDDLASCSMVKELLPGALAAAKGAHFLRLDEESLIRFPSVDVVIRGEAEAAFREILTGTDLAGVSGITWRNGAAVCRNPDRTDPGCLDNLPLPARHLIDNSSFRRLDNGRMQAVVRVSRGCPYHCFFCLATPVSGHRLRTRSTDSIVDEVRHCVERYGVRDFIFWSDIFTLDRAWVLDLSEAICRSDLKISWAANTRADTIDAEMAYAMRRSGCELLSIGVESGSEDILSRTGKRISVDQVRDAFGVIHAAGLKSLAYYMIGLPWETEETARQTIRLSRELDSDFASFFCASPLPGTRFFDYAIRTRLIPGSEDLFRVIERAYVEPAVGSHELSRERVMALQREAVRSFSFRPRYVVKRLGAIRSWAELVQHMRYLPPMARELVRGGYR